MQTLNDMMTEQVKTMVMAGVRDGDTMTIFEIFNAHIFARCPENITKAMWNELYDELMRALPHIHTETVVTVMLMRGFYLSQLEKQDENMIRWWEAHANRHQMIINN